MSPTQARLAVLILAAVATCSLPAIAQTPEAISLLGKPLVSASPTGDQKARLEADLATAQTP